MSLPFDCLKTNKRNNKSGRYSLGATLGSRMLASAHFNGPYKNNWGGEQNFTIAISANWSGMQLFPPIHLLFEKKKPLLILGCLATQTLPHMGPGHAEVSQAECGALKKKKKKASDAPRSALIHMHLEPKTHVLGRGTFPSIPFCSSHLLWSKAFPAHLLSPVRWLSNNSCYLVNRWESELNLFSNSLRLVLHSASRKPSWKAYVSRD